MRLSGLVVATLFLLSSLALAQHSSGSSGSSGGSFSSGGGGSHGGSSGGSSGSSGSHSSSSASSAHSSGSLSGGHSSGGSVSHGSNARGSNSVSGSAVSPSRGPRSTESLRSTDSKSASSIREPSHGLRESKSQPEKRGFFSFLRHPFRKPEPKPVADLRKPVCLRGPCQICPNGQVRSGGCGTGTITREHPLHGCWGRAVWSGSACVLQTNYLDECSALGAMLQRQGQRMQAAESIRQSACATGPSQECSETAASWQSEESLHQSLRQRYQQCRLQSRHAFAAGGYGPGFHGAGLFDPMRFDVSY